VPAHRRVEEAGHPTLEDLQQRIRNQVSTPNRLLVIERTADGDVLGYCGLVDGQHVGEPEIAYELLRRAWGQGYATEAAWTVLSWARSLGFRRLHATVWDWNLASRRVLTKVGFTEVGEILPAGPHGTSLLTTRQL
jgi:ribosomal-protein-alanine N-acetyltransferase